MKDYKAKFLLNNNYKYVWNKVEHVWNRWHLFAYINTKLFTSSNAEIISIRERGKDCPLG